VRLLRRLYCRLRRIPDVDELRRRGASIGSGVWFGNDVTIDYGFASLVSVGDDCTVSDRVILLAHDASTKRHIGYTRVAPVSIGRRVFLGAGAIVLPGVTIGDDAIVGAGSVVRGDVAPGTVVAGNPARVIRTTEEYVARHRAAAPGEGYVE
jgi:maltose O-acetyltransferase